MPASIVVLVLAMLVPCAWTVSCEVRARVRRMKWNEIEGAATQCRMPPFPGPFAVADTASTDRVKVRCSFGFIAPTPMSL